ncbi:hypothetical protein PPYR_14866 [Photinus pyralis]|uniref:Pyruvate kinase n=1 Tax=Photinus pyralis TaxID=7054 RepID=A0A5N4A059_PHOPY|nr:pyruvate kinase-like [Photinus pyralis]KAB0790686.1 hypothetical protein PPYR_14866 [Photinus pyralis]
MEAVNRLEHLCSLSVYKPVANVALTGIICTIGPSSRSVDVLEGMMEAGMTIARLNLASDSHAYHAETISNIRKAVEGYSKKIGSYYSLAIAVDIRGPEIRIGSVDRAGLGETTLKRGEILKLTIDQEYAEKGTNKIIYVDYENIIKFVSRGARIYLHDGNISLICTGVASDYLNCIIEVGGLLPRCADVKIPGANLDLPDVSEQDKKDINFAVEQGVDIIFASFVRSIYGPIEIRNVLGKRGEDVLIVSKIENHQGLRNIKEIISASDGVMIMRIILGLEVPPEKIFLAQKSISANCTAIGKPVVCVTVVMESMVRRNKPSRPDIADVANLIVDGMDCVVLTDETAKGPDPVSYVNQMVLICKEAETVAYQKEISLIIRSKVKFPVDIPHSVALSAVEAVEKCQASALVVVDYNDISAKLISKYRPGCPIIAVTRNKKLIPHWLLYRSILPLYINEPEAEDWLEDIDMCIGFAVKYGLRKRFLKLGDMVVVVSGWKKRSSTASAVRYMPVGDIVEL